MRVSDSDVIVLSQHFISEVSQLQEQVQGVGQVFQSIIEDSSLSGKAMATAKSYYSDVYLSVLRNTLSMVEEAKSLTTSFWSNLESAIGIGEEVDTDLLEEAERGFREERLALEELQRNPLLSMTLPLSGFIMGSEIAEKKVREKREAVERFNAQHENHFLDVRMEAEQIILLLSEMKNGIPFTNGGSSYTLSSTAQSGMDFLNKRTKEREQIAKETAPPDVGNRVWRQIEVPGGGKVWFLVEKDSIVATAEDIRVTQAYQEWLLKYGTPETREDISDLDLQYHLIVVRTGINPNTGKAVSDIEKLQSWSTLLSTAAVAAVSIYSIYQFTKPNVPAASMIDDVADDIALSGGTSGANSIITPEMEEKILWGQRTNPNKNKIIGGHSPEISNNHPNYAVEEIILNPDGTRKLKYTTQFPDGNLSKIKTSTVFPEGWSDTKILESSKSIGNNTPISVRASDGATWHRSIVDGVEIDVIKRGNEIISAYPTGTVNGPPPVGFSK
ncbi:EndoU domain-containing protein [Listeria booriae]|uniref:EndoU domain-containing protein n=1 Tax=Listeria booriae TaxID=1552123 RepID=UPI001626221F|nr:EndoU domain-containing protein [Listeria booriae]MBC2149783.1 transposase [Listeria booriae]